MDLKELAREATMQACGRKCECRDAGVDPSEWAPCDDEFAAALAALKLAKERGLLREPAPPPRVPPVEFVPTHRTRVFDEPVMLVGLPDGMVRIHTKNGGFSTVTESRAQFLCAPLKKAP